MTMPFDPMMFDPLALGGKVDFVLDLIQEKIAIAQDDALRRDYANALLRLDAGAEDLLRLPGTGSAVRHLRGIHAEAAAQSARPAEGLETAKTGLKAYKDYRALAEQHLAAEHRERDAAAEKLKQDAVKGIRFAGRAALVDELVAQIAKNDPYIGKIAGNAALRDQTTHLLQTARGSATTAEWDKADEDLGHAETAAKTVLKNWKNAQKGAGKSKAWFAKIEVLLEGARDALSEEQCATERKGAMDLYFPVLQGKAKDKDQAAKLEPLHGTVTARIVEARKVRVACKKKVDAVKKAVSQLLGFALPRQVGVLMHRGTEVDRAFVGYRYADAERDADVLLKDLATKSDVLKDESVRWVAAAKTELPAALGNVAEQAKYEGFRPPESPAGLGNALRALEAQVGTVTTYGEALDELERLELLVVRNASLFDSWRSLESQRASADAAVADATAGADAALEALGEALAVVAKSQGKGEDWKPFDLGGMSGELAALKTAWAERKATATTPEELDPRAIVDKLAQLRTRAEALAGDTDGLKGTVASDDTARARAAYKVVHDRLLSLLDELDGYPTPQAKKLREQLRSFDASLLQELDAAAITALVGDAESLEETAKGDRALVSGLLSRARSSLERDLVAAEGRLAALKKAANKRALLGKLQDARQRALQRVVVLEEGILAVRGQLGSDYLDAFSQGTTELRAIVVDIEVLIELCKGKEVEAPVPATWQKQILWCRELIADKEWKRFRASVQWELGEHLDDITAMLPSAHSSKIEAELGAWRKAWLVGADRIKTDQRDLQTFTKRHDEVGKAWKKALPKFASYPDLQKRIERDLSSAKKGVEQEDGIQLAIATVERVNGEIEGIVSSRNPAPDLRRMDDAAKAETVAAKEQEAAWKARKKVFEERWLPRLSGKGKKEVEGLLDVANKTAGRSDFDNATRYLDLAAERAALVLQFPDGMAATSLKKLPEAARKWTAGVAAYRDELALCETFFSGQAEPARAPLVSGVQELRKLFDPDAFGVAVAAICASGVDLDTRLKHREAALTVLRRYRSSLEQDARFRLLAAHPFEDLAKFRGHFELQAPLIDLERLLLMAVSTT